MVKLWRCEICGDPYIGDTPPDNCPFCGAHRKYIKEANQSADRQERVEVNFSVELNEKDKINAEHALQVEISNSAFYFCAAEKTDNSEGKLLFKALGKIEAEHAAIWRKILKLSGIPKGNETCYTVNTENLKESHARETRAIEFYKNSAKEAKNSRIKQIFNALVEIETDHLHLSSSASFSENLFR